MFKRKNNEVVSLFVTDISRCLLLNYSIFPFTRLQVVLPVWVLSSRDCCTALAGRQRATSGAMISRWLIGLWLVSPLHQEHPAGTSSSRLRGRPRPGSVQQVAPVLLRTAEATTQAIFQKTVTCCRFLTVNVAVCDFY